MILDKILASTKKRVELAKQKQTPSELLKALDNTQIDVVSFKSAIKDYNGLSIIAEIKKASPSKGLIREDFNHIEIAKEYQNCDIQAISVLTEPEFFKGELKFVTDVIGVSNKSVLRKDFIIDEYQIYEAKLSGASAILLIMAALTAKEFNNLYTKAKDLGLDVLTETHNREEVLRASEKAKIIGINNRDLQTFKEDIHTTEKLLEFVPDGCVVVSESSIRVHSDYEYIKSLGVDGILVGEAFMREQNVADAVKKLRCGL